MPNVLKTNRKRASLTQKELAEKAKISTSYLNLIETGKKKPTASVIRRLAKALGEDPEEWLDIAGYTVEGARGEKLASTISPGLGVDAAAIRIVGELGAGGSKFYDQDGPLEVLPNTAVRVMDGSLQAFGYQTGDLLLVRKDNIFPGDLVVCMEGGEPLLKIGDESSYGENVIGKVYGLIRKYASSDSRSTVIRQVGEVAPLQSPEMQETLKDIKSLLSKMVSEDESPE